VCVVKTREQKNNIGEYNEQNNIPVLFFSFIHIPKQEKYISSTNLVQNHIVHKAFYLQYSNGLVLMGNLQFVLE
jgi:hypothetical protein